jgi:hypothetical protein
MPVVGALDVLAISIKPARRIPTRGLRPVRRPNQAMFRYPSQNPPGQKSRNWAIGAQEEATEQGN